MPSRQAPRHDTICDPGPKCLHPGTQWAKMAQRAVDPAASAIPTSYLATFSLGCSVKTTSVTTTSFVTQPMRSLVSAIPPSLSKPHAGIREPFTGTPGPTCQPSSKLPGLLAQNQTKGRRMKWKCDLDRFPKFYAKYSNLHPNSKLKLCPCVP